MSDAIEKLFSVSRLKNKWEDTPTVQAKEEVKEEKVLEQRPQSLLELWQDSLDALREEFPTANFTEQIDELSEELKSFSERNFNSAEVKEELCEKLRFLESLMDDWILANRIA